MYGFKLFKEQKRIISASIEDGFVKMAQNCCVQMVIHQLAKSESANGHSFHLTVRWSEPIWSRISRECQNSPMQNIKYQLGHFGIPNIMLVTNTFTGPISVNAILGDFGNIVFNIVSHTV